MPDTVEVCAATVCIDLSVLDIKVLVLLACCQNPLARLIKLAAHMGI